MKQYAAVPFIRTQHGQMQTPRGMLRLLTITFCLGLLQPFAAMAQTNAPAPLPPAAEEALTKGIIAAKVPDYLLAIRFFEEARKLAPQAPVIYLNLGLAESRIPGRELRAIAWFGAYLATYPDAPNAAAVKEQITVLDVRNQSNVSRLIKSVQDAANLLPDREVAPIVINFRQGSPLHKAAVLWARSGNSAAALQTAARIQDTYWRGWAQGAIGLARAEVGDKVGARELFVLATRTNEREPGGKSITKMRVAEALAQMGDIADALRTADSIQDAWSGAFTKCLIADAQVDAGDMMGARQTLAGALQTADRVRDAQEKSSVYLSIAMAQANARDARAALITAERIREDSGKSLVQEAIAVAQIGAQAESGDIAGALQATDRISKDRGPAQQAIAIALAKSGDFAGAQKIADRIQDTRNKYWAQAGVAKAQAQARLGKSIPVEEWIAKNTDFLNTPIFLDLGEALKALATRGPKETFAALHDIAGEMIDKRLVISELLKQQAK